MTQIIRISEYKQKNTVLPFTRTEIKQLLQVYASKVRTGEWKDYSIGNTPSFARFSVYRSSKEEPMFAITKLAQRKKARSKKITNFKYLVTSRQKTIIQKTSLIKALKVFDKPVKLVQKIN